MHMLYNSENFAVVHFEVSEPAADLMTQTRPRGGYEIVDKHARREIFLQGALAERFMRGVEDLIRRSPSEEAIDDYLEGFADLAQQPLVLH